MKIKQKNELLKDIRIRQFQSRDLYNVQKLFLENLRSYKEPIILKETNHFFTKSRLKQDMADIKTNYLDVDGGNFWVAEETRLDIHGKKISHVVGCVGTLPRRTFNDDALVELNNNDTTKQHRNSKLFELMRMSVHSDYRGKGLAQALVSTLENHAFNEQNGDKIFLSTLSEMKQACRFYEKQGFRKTGKTKEFRLREINPSAIDGTVHLLYFEKCHHNCY